MTNLDIVYQVKSSVKTSNGMTFREPLLLKRESSHFRIIKGMCVNGDIAFRPGALIYLNEATVEIYHFESNYSIF